MHVHICVYYIFVLYILYNIINCTVCSKISAAQLCCAVSFHIHVHNYYMLVFIYVLTAHNCVLSPTEFWLYKSIGDSQIVSSYSFSIDHPKQREFGRQCVHDHWQVSLSNLKNEVN